MIVKNKHIGSYGVIIEDDKIVGAVTHVIVNDSKKGYGIFITKMLKEADN